MCFYKECQIQVTFINVSLVEVWLATKCNEDVLWPKM